MSRHLGGKRTNALELGAGTGIATEAIVPHLTGAYYVATDISNGMLIHLKRRELGIPLCQSDAHFLPFRTNVFELTVCCEVLEHLFFSSQALSEISRCGKVNGYLFVSTPNKESFYNSGMSKQPIDRWLSPLELKSLLEKAGFYVVKSFTVYHIPPLLNKLLYFRAWVFSIFHKIRILQLFEGFRSVPFLRNRGLYNIVVCRKQLRPSSDTDILN